MREQEIIQRIKHFIKDLSDSIKPLENAEEKIEFIQALKKLLIGIYKSNSFNEYFEAEHFEEDAFIDEHLLAKFRSKMKPFVASKLHYYFSPDESMQIAINEKWHTEQPVILDHEEFLDYTLRLYNFLDLLKTNLYLSEPGKVDSQKQIEELAAQKPDENLQGNLKLKSNEFTRSRQALGMFYLFKSIGITVRNEIPLVNLAKFAHLLSALPYDKPDNSSIYKIMKELPDLKKEKNLLEDLEFVKKHFELVKHKEAVILIEKEILALEEKLKFKD